MNKLFTQLCGFRKIMVAFALMVVITLGFKNSAYALGGVPIDTEVDRHSIMSNLKDFTLDKLAYIAAKQILHKMTGDIINWINSGFHGSPQFLTNPDQFFLSAADQATGEFLAMKKNAPLASLCSPWSVDLRLSLAITQANTKFNGVQPIYTCTLGKIINNALNTKVNVSANVVETNVQINKFVTGDFHQGGWSTFLGLTTDPANNPYSNGLNARSDMAMVAAQKQALYSADLSLGMGFLSQQKCTDVADDVAEEFDGVPGYQRTSSGKMQHCENVTPGSAIAGVLKDQLGVPTQELELADNINAVVNALFDQLITQTLQTGLAKISSGGGGGGGTSYIQTVINDATAAKTITGGATDPVVSALNGIKSTYTNAIGLVTDSKTKYQTAQNCFEAKHNSGTLDSYNDGLAVTKIANIQNKITTDVSVLQNKLQTLSDAVDYQISSAKAASTQSTPATSNINVLLQSVNNAVASSLESSDVQISSQSLIDAQTTASANLTSTQTKTAEYNADAKSYQALCDLIH